MKRLTLAALLALGCGSGDSGDVTMATGDPHYYVVNGLTLPMGRTDCSIDLNGDTKVDNALGTIIGALSTQGMLDPTAQVNMAINNGQVILLVSVTTTDLANASNVGVNLYLGKDTMMPDFTSGMGMFTVDSGQSPAKFFGKIASSKFNSNSPVTTKNPVTVTLKLPLIAGADPINLTLNGGHIQFKTGSDATTMKPGLTDGQLHGSIKKSDIDNTIIPAVAKLLTATIAKDCMGGGGDGGAAPDGGAGGCTGSAMQIKSLFDTGMCMNPDGSMAKAGDSKIDTCEVATNSIIMNVLSPDIQVFDASGNYAPNAMNTTKDSLSLGLCFTATAAGKFGGL